MGYNTPPHGSWPGMRSWVDALEAAGPLPFIRGNWYFVDPYSGSDSADGTTVATPLASFEAAEALCISGAGDGICLMSRGTGTASHTTSYLTQEMAFDKSGITVFGAAAPIPMFGRARIANKTITTAAATDISQAAHAINRVAGSFITDGWEVGMKGVIADSGSNNGATFTVTAVSATSITVSETLNVQAATSTVSCVLTSYMVNLMTISGTNNTFINVEFWNGGSNALEIGGIVISGNRNAFIRCHATGGAGAAVAATKYSVKLNGSYENYWLGGAIGSDTFDHGNNADAEVVINGVCGRNRFEGAEIISFVSTGTAHAAVKSIGTTGGSPTMFRNCLFNSLLSGTTPAAVHITSGVCDKVGMAGSSAFNFTAWGAYADMPATAASAGGGLATTA